MSDDVDIGAIWAAARRDLEWSDYSTLLNAGVPSTALLFDGDFAVGAVSVAIQNGRWVEKVPGDRAIVVPAEDAAGDVVDLVAFCPDRPRTFGSLLGAAPLIGFDALRQAEWCAAPLSVYETPLEWLRAGRSGVVILEWRTYWPLWFTDRIPYLQAGSESFALKLLAALERPLPAVDVRFAA